MALLFIYLFHFIYFFFGGSGAIATNLIIETDGTKTKCLLKDYGRAVLYQN